MHRVLEEVYSTSVDASPHCLRSTDTTTVLACSYKLFVNSHKNAYIGSRGFVGTIYDIRDGLRRGLAIRVYSCVASFSLHACSRVNPIVLGMYVVA